MAGPRRIVRGDQFLEAARRYFPPGGSADGSPSFELFEERILLIAERRMSESYEDLPEALAGTGIRFVMTHAVPYFPALVIYGMLVAIGAEEVVELVDVVVDEDYFDTIENDPDF